MTEENPFAKGKAHVDESKVFLLNPEDVKVSDERKRQRQDVGSITNLVASIAKYGQIHPIVIDRNGELIVGGRRLAACILGGFQVKAI